MNPVEIIRKKREGGRLSREELQFFISGYLAGSVAEYQMAAFLMAVYYKNMDFDETTTLTDIMLHSGAVIDLSSIPGKKIDKHSTGGVGDKVSLILAPMVAACGVPVPMISGRGLGHTGGTLDKLEAIPGFRTDYSLDEYKRILADVGLVMSGQTAEIAPADKRMYALRDVTATVESIPLIAGSIMSKKLAAGLDGLVLDVKTGRGAFMQSKESAIQLAETLVAVGTRSGKQTVGYLTDMSQPLGFAVGNWLEVVECIECLRGKDIPDLMGITYVLGGTMVMLGGKATDVQAGIELCRKTIQDGSAWEVFQKMVKRQGGDPSITEHPEAYPASAFSLDITADVDGDIGTIDALEIGFAAIQLGAGRMKVDDRIDPAAGIVFRKKVGDIVTEGEILATVYAHSAGQLEDAAHRIRRAFTISEEPSVAPPLIHALIDASGVHEWSGNSPS